MRARRRVLTAAAIVLALVVGLATIGPLLGGGGRAPATVPARAQEAPTPTPVPPDRRLVLTYYYYWYDATTGAHLQESAGLRYHPPPSPAASWRSGEWQATQLADMAYAGIDVVLPVYWGFDRPDDQWSTQGLAVLADAWRFLKANGARPPAIGLFLDTAIVDRRDLTTPDGKAWFYANFKDFFTRIPRDEWALVNGQPIAFLFTSDATGAVDQSTFDYVYDHFQADFGVRPYIVREVSWDYPILRWENGERVRDYGSPIKTENSYIWAASVFGYVDRGGVATVGPGYDDSRIPDRHGGRVVDRQGGAFYRKAFDAAIASGKPLVAIETWNELHEGSSIAETVEYGRQYVELTRELTARFHAAGP